MGVLVLALVASGATLASNLAYAPADVPDAPPIRVMTYNVHQWFSEGKTGHHNLREVAEVVRRGGAHVVGLQESEGARLTGGNLDGVRWLAHELGYHAFYGPATSEQIYGVSLLSVYPILDARVVALPAEESIERVAVVATVDAPSGPLPVVVTHLQTGEYPADRTAQAQVIVDLATVQERAVVLGDFNTQPDPADPAYQVLDGSLTDAWVAAGNPRNASAGFTSTAGDPHQRIDHVWLHGTWSVDSVEVLGDWRASDHRAVVASVTPEGGGAGR